MTTHELARELLGKPDVMVTVRGYEGGVDEIQFVRNVNKLHLNVNDEWYYGKHDYDHYGCESGCTHVIVDAIQID